MRRACSCPRSDLPNMKLLHAPSRPGTLDFCLLHRLSCQHVSALLLFSDVSDKERHEDGPGQAPHPDGEWTWQVWPFSIWTRHIWLLCPWVNHLSMLHLLQHEGEILTVKRGLHALFFPWATCSHQESDKKVLTGQLCSLCCFHFTIFAWSSDLCRSCF